jgi:hypothetical protein
LSTPIAIVTALAAALLLGISAAADQRSTKKVKVRRVLSPEILLDLVRQRLWLFAIAANIAGFGLQVVALSFGSLALVQPLLVGDLVFSVLILRVWLRRTGVEMPRTGPVFLGIAATALGVAAFLVIAQPSGGRTHVSIGVLPLLAGAYAGTVGGCLVVAARRRTLRPLALALACGISYGVAAFLIKLVTGQFSGGPAQVFTSWPIYLFLVVGPAGFILNQDAFQQGTFLAPVQAIITAADPVLSIGLGIVLLDVHFRSGPANVAGEIVALLVMTAGIVITANAASENKVACASMPEVGQHHQPRWRPHRRSAGR